MYCLKLLEISKIFDIKLVNKLDLFMKHKCSILERKSINPFKFMNLTGVDMNTTMSLFLTAVEENLFEVIVLYKCHCGDTGCITNLSEEFICEEGCSSIPNENKENVILLFKLNEKISECEFLNQSVYPLDFLENFDMCKEPSLAAISSEVRDESVIAKLRNDLFKR